MLTQTANSQIELSLVQTPFEYVLDHDNDLFRLAKSLKWDEIEREVTAHYSQSMGRPSVPIRTMVGLNLYKFLRNRSDADVIKEYQENLYVQYLCGNQYFQAQTPCAVNMMTLFRQRVGEAFFQYLLEQTIELFGPGILVEDLVADTTVAPKNVARPNDQNLLMRTCDYCHKLADKYQISLNNTFKRELKSIKQTLRFEKNKKNEKEIKKCKRRLYTITGRLVRELKRKINPEDLANESELFDIFDRILVQAEPDTIYRNDKKAESEIAEVTAAYNQCKDYAAELGIELKSDYDTKLKEQIDIAKTTSDKGKQKIINAAISKAFTIVKHIASDLLSIFPDIDNISIQDQSIYNGLIEIHRNMNEHGKDHKIYSIHEPHTRAIIKDKPGSKYEYGCKVSFVKTTKSNVIVSVVPFFNNEHDAKTLEPSLDMATELGVKSENVLTDRSYRSASVGNNEIKHIIPELPNEKDTKSERKQKQKMCAQRSGIEPIIGHLKSDHRLNKIYLKGKFGDTVNAYMSAIAYNLTNYLRTKSCR